MVKDGTKQLAEQFLKDQLRIMEKHGDKPRLDAKQYRQVVSEVQRSFEAMRPRKQKTA